MVLHKLEDFEPNYTDAFDGNDIKGYEVYSDRDNEKVGTVKNILVDESGRFRYLIVDTGFWIFGKQVLLPVGRMRIDRGDRRVYAMGFTKEQAEALPEFSDDLKVDYDYEEQVRGVYRDRPLDTTVTPLETSAASMPYVAPAAYDRNTYNYEQEPELYDMGDRNQDTLKLYEERLVANKTRRKAGEVSIGKHVETETQRVSVPVEKERVVIERSTPDNAGKPAAPEEAPFREGEVAHMELYEEQPDIRKEAVLREEVKIRKEVEQEIVSTQEQVRREELDINSEGRPIVDKDR
ncbi:photosystem reaction center subunit H [cyanobacterium TDX16]|nr:photosystem reaction center subunit H [cyanobacterium TDX16]